MTCHVLVNRPDGKTPARQCDNFSRAACAPCLQQRPDPVRCALHPGRIFNSSSALTMERIGHD